MSFMTTRWRRRAGPKGLRPAPLRLRALASSINLLSALGAVAAALIATTWIARARRPLGEQGPRPGGIVAELGGDADPANSRDGTKSLPERVVEYSGHRRFKLGLLLLTFTIGVLTEGRRGIGARIVGLQLVDASTGRAITRRQAAIRTSSQLVSSAVAHRLAPRPKTLNAAEHRRLHEQVREAKETDTGDEHARQERLTRIYEEQKLRPQAYLLPLLADLMLRLGAGLPIWSKRKQNIHDLVAGTITVRTPRTSRRAQVR
jgi:hypothetical protein